MENGRQTSLEAALARTEAAAEEARKAAQAALSAVKKYRAAAATGNLRELPRAADTAKRSVSWLGQQLTNAVESWDFDEESYLTSGEYARELLAQARHQSLQIFEQDERLFCYPALVRVLPNERVVLIDKARERRLRPSVLVAHLKDLQRRPPRFRPEIFLGSIFRAYTYAVAGLAQDGRAREGRARERRAQEQLASSPVIPLRTIYDLLTLLPGSGRDYSLAEFARDIYLLDGSGVTATRDGWVVGFPASTATRSPGATIRVITQSGEEKKYYGVSFSRSESES